MSVLVIAEYDQAGLKPATRSVITAAAVLGTDIHVLVAGHDASAAAALAATVQGVTKVLHADAPYYGEQTAENLAVLVQSLAGVYRHVLAPATSFGKNLLPRVAALLDVAPLSDVCGIVSPDTFVRPIYAGNALATVQSADPIKVITVRPTAFAPADDGAGAPIEAIDAGPDLGLTQVQSRALSASARPDLSAAKVVVAGGRGLVSGEHYRSLLEPLADKLNAALGASRAAVDAGFVSNDHQVGQTGKVVAPELYLAIGISGAIQHLAGMRDSRIIVAINKDPDAPIFQVADYGLVGDLFKLVPELTEAL
ncbi:MAG: FAD-binding protein [Rhodocyclaceae bacterium]|nr:FAD-binding protein [Rhodocyclaceae bacterium]MDZ4214219.1 FAD-binding protein [Rhodocyclaceae bacterium]